MTAIEAYRRLRAFPVFRTADAAALLHMTMSASTKTLSRLAAQHVLVKLCRGLWTWPETDLQILPEYISAPAPSYVSFQTALYYHGLISQIPRVTYAATLSRARQVETPLGVISFHHVPPALFGGFDVVGPQGVKLATAEKALVDFLYMAPARSRLFTSLPELTLPKAFHIRKARVWIATIPSAARRKSVRNRFESLLLIPHATRTR